MHRRSEPDPPAGLASHFDAVVMLTASDWKTEPRSNRYHYAVRFARELPVAFVQPDRHRPGVEWEATAHDNLRLLHIPFHEHPASATRTLRSALIAADIRRPLVWVNSPHFADYLELSRAPAIVFHATEDYFTESSMRGALAWSESFMDSLRRTLATADLLVAVSQGVIESYRGRGGYRGRGIVLANGCDYHFWQRFAVASVEQSQQPIALYQGGINRRLDFDLLVDLARAAPAWSFELCGRIVDPGPGWPALLGLPNVRYLGDLSPEEVGAAMGRATVGLIPFLADDVIWVSLPLKAYEYVAAGLPVVSVPIEALSTRPELFEIARSAAEFHAAMERVRHQRCEPAALAMRRDAASLEDYDARFSQLKQRIAVLIGEQRASPPRLNVLVVYDDASMHVAAIREHVEAFSRHSVHNVYFVSGTRPVPGRPDFGGFDVVVIHFSVRLSLTWHLTAAMAEAIELFEGPKVAFIQDEYDTVDVALDWLDRFRVDCLFTCVPSAYVDLVYSRERFPRMRTVGTLTGFVPEDPVIEDYALPMAQRRIRIGYRGRMLPWFYGDLGREKYEIGVRVARRAQELGISVDIECDDARRIYGVDWYRFIGSCRAVLGTESGSNVFDFDGTIKARVENSMARNPDVSYEEVRRTVLEPHEGRIRMNQISPKIFEAVRLRTALILYEGTYSGVIRPDEHYIPLRKDLSNLDAVLASLEDLDGLAQLTDRAYRDIVESGNFSYRAFVRGCDQEFAALAPRPTLGAVLASPLLLLPRVGSTRGFHGGDITQSACWPLSMPVPRSVWEGPIRPFEPPLAGGEPGPEEYRATGWRGRIGRIINRAARSDAPVHRGVRRVWRLLPISFRRQVARLRA